MYSQLSSLAHVQNKSLFETNGGKRGNGCLLLTLPYLALKMTNISGNLLNHKSKASSFVSLYFYFCLLAIEATASLKQVCISSSNVNSYWGLSISSYLCVLSNTDQLQMFSSWLLGVSLRRREKSLSCSIDQTFWLHRKHCVTPGSKLQQPRMLFNSASLITCNVGVQNAE